MKTQIRKPAAGKTLYAAEYREESVKHWKYSGRRAATVAAEPGIRGSLLDSERPEVSPFASCLPRLASEHSPARRRNRTSC